MLVPALSIGLFTRILKKQGYQTDLFETTAYLSDEPSSSANRVKMLNARAFDMGEDLGITVKEDMYGDFRQKVLDFQPDLMFFSVVEDAFRQTVSLLNVVEDLDILHLLGGVFPTNAAKRCFDFPEVKMIGVGEGEKIVAQVAEAIRSNQSVEDIPGVHLRLPDGTVKKNLPQPLVNINDTSPDFSLFDPVRFQRPMGGRIFKMIPVETYRGCPYGCTYCNSPSQRSFAKTNDLGALLSG